MTFAREHQDHRENVFLDLKSVQEFIDLQEHAEIPQINLLHLQLLCLNER